MPTPIGAAMSASCRADPARGFDPHDTVAMICGPEMMMRFTVDALRDAGRRRRSASIVSMERNMKCAIGLCGHCQFGPTFVCKDGPVLRFDRIAAISCDAGDLTMARQRKPTLAVWKFASCDGCQLTLLDCEDELLALAGAVEIANFPEASSAVVERALRPVAGRRLDHHRARCRAHPARCAAHRSMLVTIGACATAGGIQALRNFADVERIPSRRLRAARVHRHARRRRRRSPSTSRSTSSCTAARSTSGNCSR